MKIDKQKITIIGLAVGLFLVVEYIVLDEWNEFNQEKIQEIFSQGYARGLEDATNAVYTQTQDCHPAVLKMGNLTKTIFDFSCIQTPEEIP